MAKETSASVVDSIRQALKEKGGGGNMPEELFFVPKDGKKIIRFLSEFDEAIEVIMHDKYGAFMPQPCLKYYDKECPFHGRGFRTKTNYAWTVYDYESKQKRILISPPTQNSALEDLVAIWEEFGTLRDRDVRIRRSGGDKSTYRARDLAKAKFEGDYSKPFTKGKVLAILEGLISETEIKADDGDDDDRPKKGAKDDDDDRPRKQSGDKDEPRPKKKARDADEED